MYAKLVARFVNGRVKKGVSDDFLLLRETFHLREDGLEPGTPEEIRISDLKAVFFVGDYRGNADYHDNKSAKRPSYDHRVSVRFPDGEEIVGYTEDDLTRTEVLRLVPTDPMSNNTLIFVVTKNTASIQPLDV